MNHVTVKNRGVGGVPGGRWLGHLCLLAMAAALTGCGSTGLRYAVDQAGKAVEVARNTPGLPESAATALDDAGSLLGEVKKTVGTPSPHLQRPYTRSNAQEAVNLARQEREESERIKGMLTNLATTYLPTTGVGGLAWLLFGMWKNKKKALAEKKEAEAERDEHAEGLLVMAGSIESGKANGPVKRQLAKVAHPSVEAAVQKMNTERAKSATDSA